MTDPYLAGFSDKAAVLAASERYWNPDKTRFWQEVDVPLVIGRREGYVLTDINGHELIDVHLNGGTYNLGHRNPDLIKALTDGLAYFDIGNHHFPSPSRTALAMKLLALSGQPFERVAYATSGSEAIDLAIKSARFATGRRRIISIRKAYHGHTGLAVATGDERFSRLFLADRPEEFEQVPFNDLDAMRTALRAEPAAAVIMETIPATYGFPLPEPGYLAAIRALCDETGALYIADEVQTGLMRSGVLWAISRQKVQPDILVTSKGLGGGIYPFGALLMTKAAGGWLDRDGFAICPPSPGLRLGVMWHPPCWISPPVRRPWPMCMLLSTSLRKGLRISVRAMRTGLLVSVRKADYRSGIQRCTGCQTRHARALQARGLGYFLHA